MKKKINQRTKELSFIFGMSWGAIFIYMILLPYVGITTVDITDITSWASTIISLIIGTAITIAIWQYQKHDQKFMNSQLESMTNIQNNILNLTTEVKKITENLEKISKEQHAIIAGNEELRKSQYTFTVKTITEKLFKMKKTIEMYKDDRKEDKFYPIRMAERFFEDIIDILRASKRLIDPVKYGKIESLIMPAYNVAMGSSILKINDKVCDVDDFLDQLTFLSSELVPSEK